MDWKNQPYWLKGGLLFTLIGVLIAVTGLLNMGIANLSGADTAIIGKIFVFLGFLISFPLILTIICIFLFIFSGIIFSSPVYLFFIYLVSLFLIGAILGRLFEKYKQGCSWAKGGLIGIAVAFGASFIFVLWLSIWFLPSAMAPYSLIIIYPLAIIVPIVYFVAFLIGALISKKAAKIKAEMVVKERIIEKIYTSREKPSNWWYLLPIVLSIIGGVIGYFLLRNRDRKFAERLLIIGIIMLAISIILQIVLAGFTYYSISAIQLPRPEAPPAIGEGTNNTSGESVTVPERLAVIKIPR